MEYRRLGNSGLEVSAVGLGTNNFGGRTDYAATEMVIKQTIECGINMIDTSNSYSAGKSEEFIGKAIKGNRDKVIIATKVASAMAQGPNQRGASRKHILAEIEKSLKRLDTDYVDLYQVHFPDPATPIEETMRTLDDLVRAGKVRYIGCSNFASWQIAQAMETAKALHLEPFVSDQPEYSMLRRDVDREVVPCCRAYGLGILPFYPLASGFLTGKYKRGQAAPAGTRLAGSRQAANLLTNANFDVLEQLENFAAERGHSMVDLAFAWLLANPVVSSVIAGATKPEQVTENARTCEWRLTPDDMKALDPVLAKWK
ncbi:MAG: aldo/keto reductase [Chloroflexi bacterium]|nr:aldo/keto reductase [Chloroflexota bacterium]